MDKIELLPCPFCGNEPKYYETPDNNGDRVICRLGHVRFRTVEGWNTRADSAKLASAIEVLRLLVNPEFWDCLEPECGGVGSCQNDSHGKVVWITHAEGNGYDDARKWLEENDK